MQKPGGSEYPIWATQDGAPIGSQPPAWLSCQRNALLIHLTAQLDDRMDTLPRHTSWPIPASSRIDELRPIPVQLQDAPATLNGIVLAVVRRVIQQLNGLANVVANCTIRYRNCVRLPLLSGPLSILICSRAIAPCSVFIQRRPPGLKRIDDEITRLVGAAKGDAAADRSSSSTIPHGMYFSLQAHVMITGFVVPPGETAARHTRRCAPWLYNRCSSV